MTIIAHVVCLATVVVLLDIWQGLVPLLISPFIPDALPQY